MFKMKPIEYIWDKCPEYISKVSDDDYTVAEFITIEPFKWDRGYGLTVKLNGSREFQVNNVIHRNKLVIDSITIYDRDCPVLQENLLILHALVFGDIRGKFAEDSIWSLFAKLFLQNKDSLMWKYFPDYCDKYMKMFNGLK